MEDNREQLKRMITHLYTNILNAHLDTDTLNLWINRLITKQTTLYNFLINLISPRINSFNITNLIEILYVAVLNRQPTRSESSKLTSLYNDELRKYGTKERALKRMLSYFVKTNSISRYCRSVGIDNI